jgi:hypothetical protein
MARATSSTSSFWLSDIITSLDYPCSYLKLDHDRVLGGLPLGSARPLED